MNPPLESLNVFSSTDELQEAAARQVAGLLSRASERNRVHIGLAGGSTPRPVYEQLSTARSLAWEHIEVWFSDERTVEPHHEDCNYRMAREALLEHVPIPESNIHRMRGEIHPHEAATAYEQRLRRRLDSESPPRLDLLILGMGDDGHTASLFPGTAALHVSDRLAVANEVPQLETVRLTLTFPVLNAARRVLFLVAGESKAPALRQVFTGSDDPLPAARIQPIHGELRWYVDQAAASEVAAPGR